MTRDQTQFSELPARKIASVLAAALALAVAIGFLPAIHAQEVTASASVTDTNVEPGQPVEYHIVVTGGQPNRPPPAPRVDGLTFTYVGESTSMQMSNTGGGFQVTSTRSYNYNIDTDRPGRYVIPGQDIIVGSTTVRVAQVALNVTGSAAGGANGNGAAAGGRGGADQAAFVRLVVSKKSAFVGESIPVEVRCYLGVQLRADPDQNPILGGEGFSAQKFTPPQLETEVVDGSAFNVVTYKTTVTGLKTGEISIGPIDLQPNIQRPRPQSRGQRRLGSPFNDPFFNDPFGAFGGGTITRVEKLHGDAQKIEIKPLPAGAPDDFTGAVGQFKLEVEAQGNPRKIKAGDPVTLRASLSGQGSFDRMQAPVLTDENGLQTYPASQKFKADDDIRFRGTKTFEQVVIPKNARDSLPGYRFAYLDPGSGKYVTLESRPIALKVEGTAPTPPPASGQATAAASGTPAATPKAAARPEDILYIRNDPGTLLDGETFLPLFRRRIFWLWQLVPLAGFLGWAALAWRNTRARDEARARAGDLTRLQSELVRTLQGEKTGRREFYTAATRLAQLKAANAAGTSADSLTAEEVSRAKSLDADTASSLEEIFHRYDELSYSGEKTAQELVPVHERRDVLATVEKL